MQRSRHTFTPLHSPLYGGRQHGSWAARHAAALTVLLLDCQAQSMHSLEQNAGSFKQLNYRQKGGLQGRRNDSMPSMPACLLSEKGEQETCVKSWGI
jgi:hypothetical protein